MKNYAVILAGGLGERTGKEEPKQFLKVHGKILLEYILEKYNENNQIDKILLILPKAYIEKYSYLKQRYIKIFQIAQGGSSRQESSKIAINIIDKYESDKNSNVLIHLASRPCTSSKLITNVIKSLNNFQACVPAIPLFNICGRVGDCVENMNNGGGGVIDEIPNRRNLYMLQSPEGFKLDIIKKAHDKVKKEFISDCDILSFYKIAPLHFINGENTNIKITFEHDIYAVEHILKSN